MKLSAAAILIALISTSSFASTKPNQTAEHQISKNTINIAGANDEWTSTSLKVEPGDILLVRASGQIVVGSYLGRTGPDGTNNGIGLLQLKIGAATVINVGSMRYVPITEAGTAKLRVQDTNYRDNSGEFAVEVIRIPAAMIPEATPVVADN